jgi:bacillopeptidase F
MESRLKKHLKQEAYKNVLLGTLGIVVVIVLLVLFGTKILVGFSLLVGNLTGASQDTDNVTQNSATYIAPPALNPPFDATNSASITISGAAAPHEKISLYLNGEVVDSTTVKSDKSFTFTGVTLKDGDNSLKAKVMTDDNKESDFSNEVKIALINKAPSLSLDNPKDGQGYKKEESPIKVTGKTDPGVKVTVNDFRAIVDDQGTYTYLYNIHDGDNDIKVVATDDANNKITKEVKIHTQ